jgi:hypothetical protein
MVVSLYKLNTNSFSLFFSRSLTTNSFSSFLPGHWKLHTEYQVIQFIFNSSNHPTLNKDNASQNWTEVPYIDIMHLRRRGPTQWTLVYRIPDRSHFFSTTSLNFKRCMQVKNQTASPSIKLLYKLTCPGWLLTDENLLVWSNFFAQQRKNTYAATSAADGVGKYVATKNRAPAADGVGGGGAPVANAALSVDQISI